jgi:hypothetical protein
VLRSGVVKYRALVTDVNLKGTMNGWMMARKLREIDQVSLRRVRWRSGTASQDSFGYSSSALCIMCNSDRSFWCRAPLYLPHGYRFALS